MDDTLLESKRVTVLDLLDRLLETGVVVDGQVDLSVADIDLIHLGLKLVLASSATLEQHSNGSTTRLIDPPDDPPGDVPGGASFDSTHCIDLPGTTKAQAGTPIQHEPIVQTSHRDPGSEGLHPRIDFEPAKVEQGLAKLVLILVELIRRLMEKQAIRKMEGGTLNRSQLERLGEAFRRLESKMVELKRVFGLEDEDLNLDLGPVGRLM